MNNNEIKIEYVSKLAQKRQFMGYSQGVLALKAGINVRAIQQYESHARDINKASVHTLWLLSKALQCNIEDLIDIDTDCVTECIMKRLTGEVWDTGYEIVSRNITLAESKNDMRHGWKFNWHEIQAEGYEIIELYTVSDNHLQGRIAYKRMEGYYYVSHVENAPKNVGSDGEYAGVGGNLFAIICKMSRDAGFGGVVSFLSKKDNKIMNNYINVLHAKRIGTSQLMILDEEAAEFLIDKYQLKG